MAKTLIPVINTGHLISIIVTTTRLIVLCVNCKQQVTIDGIHKTVLGPLFWETQCDGNNSNGDGPTENEPDVLRPTELESNQNDVPEVTGQSDSEIEIGWVGDGHLV